MINTIKHSPIIPVFYHDDPEICMKTLKACYTGGVRVFEFVSRGSHAADNFKYLKDYRDQNYPDLKLGTGTIKTAEQAQQFIKLGSDFIVSPILNREIAKITREHHIFWIPGCMTPSEIGRAQELGAELIKIFPGSTLGPKFIKAIKPIFPDLSFMPTGGVSLEEGNLTGWFKAGTLAVGMGSALFGQHSDAKTITRNLHNAFNSIALLKTQS